ncbi:MAG: iron transporter [Spirochaetaceae bacterium]|jgi:uncharacterized protein involved in high-affinity Fe2+ transport|nr:iron transporter [Spirochaetaceae bacterium]
MKKFLVLFLVALCAAIFITGCPQQGNQAAAEADKPAEVAGAEEGAGFEEFPIGDDIELFPLNVAGVYFQPVDMLPAGNSLPAAESDMHIEADIAALENNGLGYGAGDFVPNLTVRYEIVKSGSDWKIEGSFMPMSASDGPHYGSNLKLDGAGTYNVKFIIENPESQGYLLHVDQETGVPGRFWAQPLVAEWDFDWVPRVW